MAPPNPPPEAPPVLPRLPNLPEELVSNIAVKLGSDDNFAFRLTCRALERKSFHEFATEYFKEKGFLITSDSLKALVGIASSEKLRGHLHTVIILPALFSDRAFNCCDGSGCAWKHCVRQTEAWRQYVKDQKQITRTGDDFSLLVQAFKRLPALTQLIFVDDPESISPTVDVRGLARSNRLANHKPTIFPDRPGDREYYRWRNHVWDIVMRALATSNKNTLLDFGTDLDSVRNALSVSTNLWFENYTRKGLGKALSKVHTVRLNISSRKQSHMDMDEDDGIDIVQGLNNIGTFARLFPALSHLDLTFSFSPSSSRLCNRFLARLHPKQMRSLKLARTLLGSKILISFIGEAVNLEEFSMIQVNLLTGNWKSVLKSLQKLGKLDKLQLRSLFEKYDTVSVLKPPAKSEDESGGTSATQPPAMPHDESDLTDFFMSGYDSEADYTSSEEDEDDTTDGEDWTEEKDDVRSTKAEDGSKEEEGSGESSIPRPSSTDSLPELVPASSIATNPPPVLLPGLADSPDESTSAGSNTKADKPQDQPAKDDKTDLLGAGPGCGHQISLDNRAQVEHWLPIFIEEYRVGEDENRADPHDHSVMMVGGMVFGASGATMLPPMAVPMGPAPPPATAGQPAANAASAGAGGAGNAATSAPGGNGDDDDGGGGDNS